MMLVDEACAILLRRAGGVRVHHSCTKQSYHALHVFTVWTASSAFACLQSVREVGRTGALLVLGAEDSESSEEDALVDAADPESGRVVLGLQTRDCQPCYPGSSLLDAQHRERTRQLCWGRQTPPPQCCSPSRPLRPQNLPDTIHTLNQSAPTVDAVQPDMGLPAAAVLLTCLCFRLRALSITIISVRKAINRRRLTYSPSAASYTLEQPFRVTDFRL
jgi:hypothetical protein